ncbi:MAG: DUF1295 domain-containing protein [Myxococcales bacterium]|nr:MAG: DUF1295 domain-containing protein [Myxococcales bacterium]
MMFLCWLLSLVKRDASVVDIFWGPGFVLSAWLYFVLGENHGIRNMLICTLVSVWGLRLALHIFLRARGKGEDYRYVEMREKRGEDFWWQSLFIIFFLQGILMWIIGLPLYTGQWESSYDGLAAIDWVALCIFIVGFLFEAIGDYQLTRFRAQSTNNGKVMNTGLWRYTRHPNYFGDALLWWGLYAFTLGPDGGWVVIFSPILMTFLLMRVSGVSLLEGKLTETRPDYRKYKQSTNAFFPWWPKKPAP